MIFDDDFPDGFVGESSWKHVEQALQLAAPSGGRNRSFLGTTGRLDDGLTAAQRFYAKKRLDPEWRAKKNAYYRNRKGKS